MYVFGGIEAGGTKFIAGVGSGPGDLRTETFPTLTPDKTIPQVVEFLRRHGRLQAVGIGSFGPVDLDAKSETYGFITTTPKAGWEQCDLAGRVRLALEVPLGFDTDVNAALVGEARWGAARGLKDAVYVTVGTGIGGGAMVNGQIVHGLVHPEMGHLLLARDPSDRDFKSTCQYHDDCLEGLACGPAIGRRWGIPGDHLPVDHPGWDLEARYLAAGLVNVMVALSPRRIILGGGVMQSGHLLPKVRTEFVRLLNGYVRHRLVTTDVDELIVPPGLGGESGVLGALALAEQAAKGN